MGRSLIGVLFVVLFFSLRFLPALFLCLFQFAAKSTEGKKGSDDQETARGPTPSTSAGRVPLKERPRPPADHERLDLVDPFGTEHVPTPTLPNTDNPTAVSFRTELLLIRNIIRTDCSDADLNPYVSFCFSRDCSWPAWPTS